MNRKYIPPLSLFIISAAVIAGGIFIFLTPRPIFGTVLFIARIYLIATAFLAVVSFLSGKKPQFLFDGLGYTAVAAVTVFFPKFFAASLANLFALTACVQAVTYFISAATFKKDGVELWKRRLFFGVVSAVFAALFFSKTAAAAFTISKVSGVYLIVTGVNLMGDFFSEFMDTDYARDRIKPRTYLPVPILISAFIPRRVLNFINKNISDNDKISPKDEEYVPTGNPRLEVYIHIGNDPIGKFGHMDMSFDDTVYSYGCYDTSSNKLWGFISDGTLAVCPRKPYLDQSINLENKTLIGFGIDVSDKEADEIYKKLNFLKKVLIEWKPLSVTDSENAEKYGDPASVLQRNTGAVFYKFRSGPFKTYFALGSNCVLLAHRIIGAAGAGILRVGGLVTPGTYFAYLDRRYKLKNNFVVSKTIYKSGGKDETSIDSGRLPK